jgi:hypothetical protein
MQRLLRLRYPHWRFDNGFTPQWAREGTVGRLIAGRQGR